MHHLHEYIECLNKAKPKMLLIKAEMHVPANLQNHKFSNVLFFFILFKQISKNLHLIFWNTNCLYFFLTHHACFYDKAILLIIHSHSSKDKSKLKTVFFLLRRITIEPRSFIRFPCFYIMLRIVLF